MISKDELKKLDVAALKAEAKSLKKEMFNLKLGRLSGQVKDTSQFEKLRHQIARVLTLAQEMQRGQKPQTKA
jgi:ribosomal protein L29